MIERLEKFINDKLGDKIKNDFIYNEFSLQHELGIYLRDVLGESYTVKFERHIADVLQKDKKELKDTVKHEIDIVIQEVNGNAKYGIELKFPKNGQYPEQMFSFIKDIRFCEQMLKNGFKQSYCLTVVDDKRFYSNVYGKECQKTDIYKYFRNDEDTDKNSIYKEIYKKTGKDADLENPKFILDGEYKINWEKILQADENCRYYLIEVTQALSKTNS